MSEKVRVAKIKSFKTMDSVDGTNAAFVIQTGPGEPFMAAADPELLARIIEQLLVSAATLQERRPVTVDPSKEVPGLLCSPSAWGVSWDQTSGERILALMLGQVRLGLRFPEAQALSLATQLHRPTEQVERIQPH